MKFSKLTAAALIGAIALTGCSSTNTANKVEETTTATATATTSATPSPEPTEKAKEAVVINANLTTRQHLTGEEHPHVNSDTDTRHNELKGKLTADYQASAQDATLNTSYEVYLNYTLRTQEGELYSNTVPRSKVRIIVEDVDYAYAIGTKEQYRNGEITIVAPKDGVNVKGEFKVNVRDVNN
jgi:lipoprotein